MKNLAIARKLKNMTQHDLAKSTGMSVSAISNYEKGTQEPTASKIKLFANKLNTTSDFILGLSDNPKPSKKKKED